jgi:hypothetical protein
MGRPALERSGRDADHGGAWEDVAYGAGRAAERGPLPHPQSVQHDGADPDEDVGLDDTVTGNAGHDERSGHTTTFP